MDNERRALPEGWEWHELLEVASKTKYPIGDGDHGQIKPSMYTNSGIPYIRVADISEGEIKKEKLVYISKDIHEKNLKSELHPDDIIISKTGATIGKVAIIPNEIPLANTTSSVGKITLDKTKMIPKFLVYFMNTSFFQNQMWSVSFKSAQPGFNIINLKKFNIVVPPLPTQRRIVSILEKAEETKRLRAQADELTNRLLQSVFLEMFGDPATNPKGWTLFKCKEVCQSITVGIVIRPASYYVPSGVPALRSLNIKEYGINLEKLVFISEEDNNSKLSKSIIKEHDVLIVRTGYPGTACVVPEELDGVNCIDLIIARPNQRIVESNYLCAYFNSSSGKNQTLSFQTGIAQKHLNVGAVNRTLIPVPPLPLQQKFARVVEKVESMRQSQNQSKQQIEDLFNTMMQKAFRGELET
ncbi:Type-1 restriction enzyme MjaXIP specificity protein [uncultured archaeon]|nr:Type-1 restriction enzyme MjaXIP specificity protein [uncultured archaeon]